ncbi:nuclear transport factor 2 family protein [Pseudonocardia humida]|uniref:Nuclear transport factor 2 family protein n=1 Tax=Pseudonocardia humida TaxID=2800819 RepID=A0ABT0ZRY9_9PSEU|nr:nuclear transport factor 2 family protein [Pseudonocardia humida]MCO1653485.1 nuclear transport factor 2 family protein [Pseudonocardia humida]
MTAHVDPAAAFRAAVEAADVEAAVALFAEDCVFHSPVVHAPYTGREALRAILAAVMTVFEDFRYTAEYAGPDGHVLEFACRVGDRDLQGVDILRGGTGPDDPISELAVLVRPYSAATALRTRMAELPAGGAPA